MSEQCKRENCIRLLVEALRILIPSYQPSVHWIAGGGRTVPSNLQIVQWQARQRKKNRLEFLVPWWDLQHGVSISQFLSTFASKNAEFR